MADLWFMLLQLLINFSNVLLIRTHFNLRKAAASNPGILIVIIILSKQLQEFNTAGNNLNKYKV